MQTTNHTFSIPVMGTGHSIDSPIRVAPYGISSVISIVDDLLIEKIRKFYCRKLDLPYNNIARNAEDGRAKRITAYLDLVQEIVQDKFEKIKNQPFFEENDKAKYFELLPKGSMPRRMYDRLLETDAGKVRDKLACELSRLMRPGSIDVNIMAKVDGLNYEKNGTPMSAEFSDANAALRGYANSKLSSSLVLSAGFNPRLYNYITEFKDFYRDATGKIKKKIILKVSDFRSALIQGKYLAKKGLEVYEYRIESGLNCGGHAFASDGYLLPSLLKEFREKRDMLSKTVRPLVEKFYEDEGAGFSEEWEIMEPRLTVQGGIGTSGEAQRLLDDFGMDATGWGSPFLMVPEATTVDKTTRKLLENAKEQDLYLSGVSPLGVPFNNVRNTGSEAWHQERIEKGKPGSPCPKGFLEANTEFTEQPICTASNQYQLLKLDQINQMDKDEAEKENMRQKVLDKACLCDHLGNGALIDLGILKEHRAPQAICPGPNIAWFDRTYSLREMVDHIYGRGESLVSSKRPHMFAKEMVMYVDYLEDLAEQADGNKGELRKLTKFRKNLEKGIEYCLKIADSESYKGENLASISQTAAEQKNRIVEIFKKIEEK
ncbi:hypothetical protein NC796_18605 [Aliifodinibius sp. S!AR15-10]|uniref:hypothetical protein n=1 Tax=Aliifodinibius sp. S!AR15-10 TaxID=2950437 RepID=UPI002866D289|nr:hypothetical protein [Aliifodinibius sp. S!AR15-10]MDR8393173.1 hypothetical protein [Aliifodinibius sp. S!AR15-10]